MKEKLIRNKGRFKYPGDQYRLVEDDTELSLMLIKKLREEVTEVSKELGKSDKQDLIMELSDVFEALQCLASNEDIAWVNVEVAQERKRRLRGGFDAGIVWIIKK